MKIGFHSLHALVLMLVMAFGGWQYGRAAYSLESWMYPLGPGEFLQGFTTRAWQRQLDAAFSARGTLVGLSNGLRYLLFSSGGQQVRVGHGGWLFLAEEIQYEGQLKFGRAVDTSTAMATRLDLIAATSKALAAQGVEVFVVLVPSKALVHDPELGGGRFASHIEPRYTGAIAGLRQRGVNAVDVLTKFRGIAPSTDLYARGDTHWNSEGALLAAGEIAAAVRRSGLNLAAKEFETLEIGPPIARDGDLIRLMGVADMPPPLRPPADWVRQWTTREKAGAPAQLGLFADEAVPAVLIGSSYSNAGNFHGFLQQALRAKVLNAAVGAGGLLKSMTSYLQNDAFKHSKPKALIWEIPERILRLPLSTEREWLAKMGMQDPAAAARP
jgi:alginate O-acetyltransferase complex protein AlgJ